MIRQFKSVEEYQRALMKRPGELLKFNVSPGWAVALLGVSRQRVSAMIADGQLDAVKTDDGMVLLRKAEVAAYKRLRDLVPKRQHGVIGKSWKAHKAQREVGLAKREEGLLTKFRASITLPDHE